MSVSLHDHHRRLHDLEVSFGALLELHFRDPRRRHELSEAARALAVRGEDGAAALLVRQARSYAP
ncbi:MAG: hypothetical protein ACHP7A_01285 [Caulobacterales bacterium]|jgi:hypothetical protein